MELESVDIIYIEKDEKGKEIHEYRRGSDGKLFAGVSSISGILDKPYLKQWAVNLAVDYLQERSEDSTDLISEKDFDIARKIHIKRLKDAGNIGTDIHKFLERHVDASIKKTDLPIYFPSNYSKNESITDKWYTDFLDWEHHNNVKWLYSELLVADMMYDYAGRLDAIAEVNGYITLIDFKTSSKISKEYYLQTAGYQNAIESMGGKIQKRLIIRIPKTETHKVYDRKTRKYSEERNELEFHYVPTDYSFDRDTFLSMRDVYRWMNQDKLKD